MPTNTRLDRHAWPTIASAAAGSLLAVPLGSTEQHGPHLPFSTDSDIAVELTERLAARRSDVVLAPVLPFGSSGEHADFAGTLSLGALAMEQVVLELGRSADMFAGVVFVSTHGGNAKPVARAVTRLHAEGRNVLAWSPHTDGDAHAGRFETALMLAIRPEVVHSAAAEAGNTRAIAELLPALKRDGVRRVSPNGVLGDPTGATRTEGRSILDLLTAQLCADVQAWHQ